MIVSGLNLPYTVSEHSKFVCQVNIAFENCINHSKLKVINRLISSKQKHVLRRLNQM